MVGSKGPTTGSTCEISLHGSSCQTTMVCFIRVIIPAKTKNIIKLALMLCFAFSFHLPSSGQEEKSQDSVIPLLQNDYQILRIDDPLGLGD